MYASHKCVYIPMDVDTFWYTDFAMKKLAAKNALFC